MSIHRLCFSACLAGVLAIGACNLRRPAPESAWLEVASPTLDPAARERLVAVAELIRRRAEEQGLPSVAVAVGLAGEVAWEWSWGFADKQARLAATTRTPYSLASISKPITATGLMLLVEQGQVDLDQPVNDYLGGPRLHSPTWNAGLATVQHVLQHVSGLPLHYQFFYAGINPRVPDMEETIRRYAVLVNPPGERYQYSNLGYGILDHLISHQSGLDYPSFMARRVFAPLGMEHSVVAMNQTPPPEAARRYDSDGKPIPDYDFDHPGASAVYASVHDLIRFGLFHMKTPLSGQERILRDETIERMQTEVFANGQDNGYALGWAVRTNDRGHTTVAHTGGMPGVRTTLKLVPRAGAVVAVLCNSRMSGQGGVADALLSAVVTGFEPPFTDLLGTWRGQVQHWSGSQTLMVRVEADGAVFAALDGGAEQRVDTGAPAGGRISGSFEGNLSHTDATRAEHRVLLDLQRRGDGLTGAASAHSNADRGEFAVTSWVDLRRVAE